jgi:hypothetical protein
VPVPAYGQTDGMDRTLALGHAVAALTASDVRIPEGWELVEVDAATGAPATGAQSHSPHRGARKGGSRGRRR